MTGLDVAKIVTEAWRSALDLDEITDEEFFRLGGNSLRAARLAAQVEEQLDIRFPLTVLFLDGTLAALVAECEAVLARGSDNPRE
jgi:acyl carrier protein